MAAIHQAMCAECGYESSHFEDCGLAVILDDHSPSYFADPENRQIVVLGHPLEDSILQEIGFTYQSASLQGRMMKVTPVVCQDCGTIYQIRRVFSGDNAIGLSGCLWVLVISAIIGITVGWMRQSILLGLGTIWLGAGLIFGLIDFSIDRFVRWRFKKRVKEFDRSSGCPECSSKRYATSTMFWRRLPCIACGKKAVRIRMTGIS
jgi:predicted Zn-ribbon and HTH transcriptional regulator